MDWDSISRPSIPAAAINSFDAISVPAAEVLSTEDYIRTKPETAAFDPGLSPRDRFLATFEFQRRLSEKPNAQQVTRDFVYKLPVARHIFGTLDRRAMGQALDRIRRGEPRDDMDYWLAAQMAVDEYRAQNLNTGEQIVSGGADSLAFAAELYLTRGAAGGLIGGASKLAAARTGSSVVGGIVEVAGTTALMPGTAAGAIQRQQPSVSPVLDPETKQVAALVAEDGDGLVKAALKSYLDNVIEVGTERVGEAVGPAVRALFGGKRGKVAASAFARFRARNPGATPDDFINFMEGASIQDPVTEFAEERLGEVARGVTGLDPSFGMTGALARGDFAQAGQQALVEAPILGAMGGVSMGAKAIQRGETRQQILADAQAERQSARQERAERHARGFHQPRTVVIDGQAYDVNDPALVAILDERNPTKAQYEAAGIEKPMKRERWRTTAQKIKKAREEAPDMPPAGDLDDTQEWMPQQVAPPADATTVDAGIEMGEVQTQGPAPRDQATGEDTPVVLAEQPPVVQMGDLTLYQPGTKPPSSSPAQPARPVRPHDIIELPDGSRAQVVMRAGKGMVRYVHISGPRKGRSGKIEESKARHAGAPLKPGDLALDLQFADPQGRPAKDALVRIEEVDEDGNYTVTHLDTGRPTHKRHPGWFVPQPAQGAETPPTESAAAPRLTDEEMAAIKAREQAEAARRTQEKADPNDPRLYPPGMAPAPQPAPLAETPAATADQTPAQSPPAQTQAESKAEVYEINGRFLATDDEGNILGVNFRNRAEAERAQEEARAARQASPPPTETPPAPGASPVEGQSVEEQRHEEGQKEGQGGPRLLEQPAAQPEQAVEEAAEKPTLDAMSEEDLAAYLEAKLSGKEPPKPKAKKPRAPKATRLPGESPAPKQPRTPRAPTERTAAAKRELDDAWGELEKALKSRGVYSNPFADPILIAAAAKVVAKAIKYGTLRFADLLADARQRFGDNLTERIKPLLARAWNTVRRDFGIDLDEAPEGQDDGDQQPDAGREPRAAQPEPPADSGTVEGVSGQRGGTVARNDRADGEEREGRSGVGGVGPVRRPREGDREQPPQNQGSAARREDSDSLAQNQGNPDSPAGTNVRLDPKELGAGGPKTKYRNNVAAIRLYKQLQAEGRKPTVEEQKILARYVGWGSLPQLFDEKATDDDWSAERKELRELLTDAEWEAAADSTINAHYTSAEIVQGLWKMLERLGFKGGRVLEPSAGIGNFLGLQPGPLARLTRWAAVELDKLTGGMLSYLYPQAMVYVQGFQDYAVPDNFYDLVISNVPFSDKVRILTDRAYKKFRPNLHDYFLMKSIDKTRPGGLVVIITSTGTMDKANPTVRRYVAERANLVAAYRLPDSTFGKNAGTAVVTDILIFQKRQPGTAATGPVWLNLATVPDPDGGEDIPINEYYKENPQNVLGVVDRRSRLYGAGQPHVSRTTDFEERWTKAIESVPEGIYQETARTEETERRVLDMLAGDRPGTLVVGDDGKLYRVSQGKRIEVPPPEASDKPETNARRQAARQRQIQIVKDIKPLRDAWRSVIAGELTGAAPDEMQRRRAALNKAYDAFVKKHGALNGATVKNALQGHDDEYEGLAGLELWDEQAKKAIKAAMFHKNTIRPLPSHAGASTLGEAMAVSLNTLGRIDLDKMAELLGQPAEKIGERLVRESLAFNDPSAGWVPADEYLSGNVRQKLLDAEAAAQQDKQYEPNVAALKRVIPKDIPHDHIVVDINSAWIPPEILADFAAKLLGGDPDDFLVRYVESSGDWQVGYTKKGERRHINSAAANRTWGTADAPFMDILESALSGHPITIRRRDSDGTTWVDRAATEEARDKVNELKEEFQDWVWANKERRERLVRLYNDRFNASVPRSYDGSHLTFPGMTPIGSVLPSSGKSFGGLRKHQVNAVWRIIVNGMALLGHEVGTGKTMTMAAAAMELRRLGLANKPAIIVPNSRVEATAREIQELYPQARILTAARSMDSSDRRATVARMASGDWDVVILTHENLEKMPLSDAIREEYITQELNEIRELIEAEGYDPDDDKTLKKAGRQNRTVKQLRAMLLRAQERLDDLTQGDRDSGGVTFEETGIDFIFVDEAHVFANLPIRTRMGAVKGVQTGQSKRSSNLEMIASFLQRRNNGRGVVLATGILPFDAWATTFGQVETKMEATHTGGFDIKSRFSRFLNVPELKALAQKVFDIVRVEKDPDLRKELNRPQRIDREIVVPASEAQLEFMQEIARRAEALRGRHDPSADNHLKLASDGAAASLDIRLAVPDAAEDAESKVRACVAQVVAIHNRHDGKASQMVFAEKWAAPALGFDLGKDFIQKLIEAGIPADKILDFRGVEGKKRQPLVEKLRKGGYIAIGNTATLGTGVNAQDYLAAIHHLEPAWTPDAVEQRNGRGWRQGNKIGKIEIITYLTAGTLDSWKWQVVARKQRFIEQFFDAGETERVVEEEDEEDAFKGGFEKFQALSSGNPLQFERLNLENELARLRRAQARSRKQKAQIDPEIEQEKKRIAELKQKLADLKADQEAFSQQADQDFEFTTPDGTKITDKKEAAAFMARYLARHSHRNGRVVLGTYKGFEIAVNVAILTWGDPTFNGYIGGKAQHGFSAAALKTDSPHTVWQSIDYNLRHIGQQIAETQRKLDQAEKNIQQLEEEKKRPWRDAEKLKKKEERFAKVVAALDRGLTYVPSDEDESKGAPAAKSSTAAAEAPAPDDSDAENIIEQAREEADRREEGGPERQAYGMFGGGKVRAPRQRKSMGQPHRAYHFPDPNVERQLQQSHGLERPGFWDRVKDMIARANAWRTRTWAHIPNDPHFAAAREFLYLLQIAPKTTADEAMRTIASIVDTLDNPGDMHLFERLLLADNMIAAAERGEPLRFGIQSIDQLRLWKEQLEREARGNQAVQQARALRRRIIRAIVQDLVNAKLLKPEALDNAETYFHQQVLMHHQLLQRFGASSNAQRVKNAYRRRRVKGEKLGEQYNYNTSFLEAEAAWLTKALMDLRKEELLTYLRTTYDRLPQLRREASRRNWENFVGGKENAARIEWLRRTIRQFRGNPEVVDPLLEELAQLDPTMPLRRKMARALATIRKLADEELSLDIDELSPDGEFWDKIREWADGEGQLAIAARTLLKAINERRRMIEDELGDRFVTWEDLVREDDSLEIWDVEPGNFFFRALSIPDEMVELAQAQGLEALNIQLDALRTVLAVGGARQQFVMPKEIVQQLREMAKPKPAHWVASAWGKITSGLKVWLILRPSNVIPYTLRNILGDVEAVIASTHPGILREAAKAFGPLFRYHQHRLGTGRATLKLSGDMKAARDFGVFDSSMSASELDLDKLLPFKRFFDALARGSAFDAAKQFLLEPYKEMPQFVANVLRFGAFVYFKKQLAAGTLKHYGAADRRTVEQIHKVYGIDAAAAHLARKLMGDYLDISQMGQWLSRWPIPFYRWIEMNTNRYRMIAKNHLDILTETGRRKGPAAAAVYGGLAIGATAGLWALQQLWNLLMHGDEEEELSPADRNTPHLLFGRREDGTIRILRNTSSLGDVFEVTGLQSLANLLPQYLRGQLTMSDMAKEMGKAPFNALWQSLHPAIKLPTDVARGQSSYPDAFNPRTQARDQILAEGLGVNQEYKAIKGRLMRTGERAQPHYHWFQVLSSVDPRRNALSEITDLRQAYLRKKGRPVETSFGLSKYRNMRDAAAIGDPAAFADARRAFLRDGGTWEGFLRHLDSIDPLENRLKEEDEQDFIDNFLTAKQRERLTVARDYADELRGRMLQFWLDAAEQDDPAQQAAFERELREQRLRLRKQLRAGFSYRRQPGETVEEYQERKRRHFERKERARKLLADLTTA